MFNISKKESEFSMKKLFIFIVLLSAFVPVAYTTQVNAPVDVRKQYDHLKNLIYKADVEAFKIAFAQLTEKRNIKLDLEQVVVEVKTATIEEIEVLGDTNKNWSKVARGGLAKIVGLIGGISGLAGLIWTLDETINEDTILPVRKFSFKAAVPVIIPTRALLDLITGEMPRLWSTQLIAATAGTSLLYLVAAYKGLTYGSKAFKVGWNYKQYLQDKLTKLDAIAAHITQAQTCSMEEEIQHPSEFVGYYLAGVE